MDHSDQSSFRQSIAVRLEGGIGDHILGLRVLPFIRERFPSRPIVVFSDAGGNPEQQELVWLSPYVSRVIPVFPVDPEKITDQTMGDLANLGEPFLKEIQKFRHFFDASGDRFFLDPARHLGTSPWEILAHRPELEIPVANQEDAASRLEEWQEYRLVGMNLSKLGTGFLKEAIEFLIPFLEALLANPRVAILLFYKSHFDFPHWPPHKRSMRTTALKKEIPIYEALCKSSPRLVAVKDAPIATVAAMIQCCRYFLAVDNGLKHLAWALNIPRTIVCPKLPSPLETLRWFPDFHRVLLLEAEEKSIQTHIGEALKFVLDETSTTKNPSPAHEGKRSLPKNANQ